MKKGIEILEAMLEHWSNENKQGDPGIFEVSKDIFKECNVKEYKGIPILENTLLDLDTAHLYEKEWYNNWVKEQIEFRENIKPKNDEGHLLSIITGE